MSNVKTDAEAYVQFPHHHNFFNKLWVAEQLGHICGPAGVLPTGDIPKRVVVRPIYNLAGMGVATRFIELTKERGYRAYTAALPPPHLKPNPIDTSFGDFAPEFISPVELINPTTEPLKYLTAGTFWCEAFEGRHLSTTCEWDGTGWKPVSCYEAHEVRWMPLERGQQQKVGRWTKVEIAGDYLQVALLNQLSDVGTINIETIGDKIIEVHLRPSPDPQALEFIPIFKGEEDKIVDMSARGYTFVYSYDDADRQLKHPRLGFMVRNH